MNMSLLKMSFQTKLEKNLCRCCLSEGEFCSLTMTNSGPVNTNQAYCDILMECLNLEIKPVSSYLRDSTFSICSACIWQLQETARFRHQVQQSEEQFQTMHRETVVHQPFKEVKIELTKLDDIMAMQVKQEDSDISVDVTVERGIDATDDRDYDSDEWPSKQDGEIQPQQDYITIEKPATLKKPATPKKQALPKKQATAKSTAKRPPAKKKKNPQEAENEEEAETKDDGTTKAAAGILRTKLKAKRAAFRLRPEDYRRSGDEYICTQCDKHYLNQGSLRYHVRAKHYRVAKHMCPHCGQEFMTKAPFIIHKLEAHNIDHRYKCNACRGVFNTQVQLKKHKNNFHMLGEKHRCEFCDYESFSSESLYKHKFKHRTVKEFHCRFCRKSFLRKTTLDLHERIHTGDRRKVCKVCGQAFVQKASLNYHMTKHHPEVNF